MKKIIFTLFIIHISLIIAIAQNTWFWQNPLPQGNSLNCVKFVNSNTGWAVGYHGTIIKTIDGGNNWTLISSGTMIELTSVYFTNEYTGWVVGATDPGFNIILKTTNGGINWISQSSGVNNYLTSICFINSYTGWVVGTAGLVLKTTNGGSNWNTQDTLSAAFRTVCFIDSANGWIVGGHTPGELQILRTTNGWIKLANLA